MATFMFWNINKNNVIGDIVTACHDNSVDILILAESKIPEVSLLQALNRRRRRTYLSPFNPSPRLSFFFRYPDDSVQLVHDGGGVSIRNITPPIGLDVLLVAVHLPSKLHMNDSEQVIHSVRVSQEIDKAEARIGHENSLVMGDFNMNPFETGIVAADGFHAVMDRQIALKEERTVQGEKRKFFYNPMWSRLGDASVGPAGTYFYSGGHVSYFWNSFDQVLLRPNLLQYFSPDQLTVLDSIGGKSLMSNHKIDTSISDHLPILITLQIERGTSHAI